MDFIIRAIRFTRAYFIGLSARRTYRQWLKNKPDTMAPISRDDWPESLKNPTDFYARCFYQYHLCLPQELHEHRQYFSHHRRGFGEDAFHTMWYMLFEEFRPAQFLEIGVYRGQTISLASLLQRILKIEGSVTGISPFTSVGDSVSKYSTQVNYLSDTLENFRHFHLPEPKLCREYSTAPAAIEMIASREWDCIYIDGCHDYEVAKEDWKNCSAHVRKGGIIVMDDSALATSYHPPKFASKGHPGPSRLMQEIDGNAFEEILQVGHNRVFQKK